MAHRSVRKGSAGVAHTAAYMGDTRTKKSQAKYDLTWDFLVEAKGLEPSNLLTASQALYQLSYAPSGEVRR